MTSTATRRLLVAVPLAGLALAAGLLSGGGRSAVACDGSPTCESAAARAAADSHAGGAGGSRRLGPAGRDGESARNALAGPAPAPVAGVDWSRGTMRVGGRERGWWLAVPAGPVRPELPLLMVLHGRGEDPAYAASLTGFLGEVAAGQAVAAYPAGVDQSWDAGRCCGAAHAAHVDDLAFLRALAGLLRIRPDVDPGALDLVGFSNGGKMAFDLVCSGALHPAAIAVVEAAPTTDCAHAPPTPLVQVAGTADPIVPYARPDPVLTAGGVPLVPVLTEVADWAAANHCARTPVSTPSVSTSGLGGLRPRVQTWTGCRAGVELLTYPGGTHVWQPGATARLWQFLTGQAPARDSA